MLIHRQQQTKPPRLNWITVNPVVMPPANQGDVVWIYPVATMTPRDDLVTIQLIAALNSRGQMFCLAAVAVTLPDNIHRGLPLASLRCSLFTD